MWCYGDSQWDNSSICVEMHLRTVISMLVKTIKRVQDENLGVVFLKQVTTSTQ